MSCEIPRIENNEHPLHRIEKNKNVRINEYSNEGPSFMFVIVDF